MIFIKLLNFLNSKKRTLILILILILFVLINNLNQIMNIFAPVNILEFVILGENSSFLSGDITSISLTKPISEILNMSEKDIEDKGITKVLEKGKEGFDKYLNYLKNIKVKRCYTNIDYNDWIIVELNINSDNKKLNCELKITDSGYIFVTLTDYLNYQSKAVVTKYCYKLIDYSSFNWIEKIQ